MPDQRAARLDLLGADDLLDDFLDLTKQGRAAVTGEPGQQNILETERRRGAACADVLHERSIGRRPPKRFSDFRTMA